MWNLKDHKDDKQKYLNKGSSKSATTKKYSTETKTNTTTTTKRPI